MIISLITSKKFTMSQLGLVVLIACAIMLKNDGTHTKSVTLLCVGAITCAAVIAQGMADFGHSGVQAQIDNATPSQSKAQDASASPSVGSQ